MVTWILILTLQWQGVAIYSIPDFKTFDECKTAGEFWSKVQFGNAKAVCVPQTK